MLFGPGPCRLRPGVRRIARPQAPAVKISQPIVREVTAYEDFTGRTDAAKSINIRARVSGYLDKVLFEPGAEVKKGQPLFKMNPRPYKATLDQAEGQVALNLAKLKRLHPRRGPQSAPGRHRGGQHTRSST